MIRDLDAMTDALGRARSKECVCGKIIGRTLQKCPHCGHEFIGHDRASRLRQAGKPGRPAKFDLDAPEPEAQLLDLAEPKLKVPDAARFVCQRLPNGGLQLSWPDFGVVFTLTPGEKLILRSAIG